MKNVIFITISLLSMIGLEAQRPGGGRPDFGNMPAIGVVTGNIEDKSANVPMEYANVVLYRFNDSTLVNGTVTGADGKFRLENVPYGRFYAIANFIGFNKTTIQDIKITPKQSTINLGTVYLEPASTNLEGVEVTADKARVEYKIDKKVVNVSQDLMASGNSAIAVLENVPSVQVDIEGNVSLRGSSNFTVLIDGRPSVLEGSDALQQIPAGTIDKIEIITNPSAKYDPDGVGGIINVILKKQKKPGTNGIVHASLSTGNKYEGDALINYRTKSFNLFGGFDLNYREFRMKGHTEYETYFPDTTNYRNSEMEGHMNRKGYGVKAGMDYYITDKSSITVSGRYGGYGFGRNHDIMREIYTQPATTKEYSKSEGRSSRDGTYYEANLDYLNKFNDKGHQIEVVGFYSYRVGDDRDKTSDFITNPDWIINDSAPASINTTEKDNDRDFRIKADYTKPIGKEGKFEAGVQSRIAMEHESFIFSNYDYDLREWIEDSLYSSAFNFKRNIHSAYAIYSNTRGSFGYQVGIRGEITDRNIENAQSTKAYKINRFDYFPTLHLSREFEGGHQVLLSYSRRIDRPHGHNLDPVVNYIDPYNSRVGNPGLEPEFIDSYEMSYQKRLKKSFISLETYYRITKNKITRIKQLQEDGTFVHTYQNLNRDFALGAELMVNADVTKWLNLNGSLNGYDYRLEGNVEDEDVSVSSTNWDSRLNATFKIKKTLRAQITNIYRGPSVTAQGEYKGFIMTNIAVRKDFFKNQFTTTLSVRDLFATGKREIITRGDGFYSYAYFKREAPIVTLSLSYIINNYKRQREMNGQQGGDSNGESMDMDF